ncbi:hypothetical protein [Oenococcus oeni]|uniref:hypothetical protein n=1 Tax=Oenococcus oeni TaxID=1247 RepID=UPI0002E2028B|nr:hypothetical protein [Oenococcus oeni]KEP85477.1 hypothetical protein X278_08570 [Oenococcus oeni IOEB_0205]
MEPIKNFFQLVADEEPFDNKIEQTADMINAADLVLFFGVGNSWAHCSIWS